MISVEEKRTEDDEMEKKEVRWGFNEPSVRRELNERIRNMMNRVFDYIDLFASKSPNKIAVSEYHTEEDVTWKKFSQATKAFACLLHSYGVQKGDVIATSLPFLKEHAFLMVGAFRLGVIVAPIDLRLTSREIITNFNKINPKMYFFLGKTPVKDFRPIVQEVMENIDSVEHWIQFQKDIDGVIKGAIHAKVFAKNIKYHYLWNSLKESFCCSGITSIEKKINKRDPILIIFTTGSTGEAKPAVLCHEGFILQLISNDFAFLEPLKRKLGKEVIVLANLPPSHIGGLSQFFTSILKGEERIVLMHIFNPENSLDAIEKYGIDLIGQIPALYNMQWNLENYKKYDLSSLKFGAYGGQGVSLSFLKRMLIMCGGIDNGGVGSTYGCTEVSGVSVYTPFDATAEEIVSSLGFDTDHCPLTIREPMKEDGSAGEEVKIGEIGEICFSGPQIFLGYYNQEETTRKTLSTDGILYTGDIGSYNINGLKFSSRRKFIIKPKGFQVFPPEIEDYIINNTKNVQYCGVVGVDHKVYSQGVVAVVKFERERKEDEEEKDETKISRIMEVCKKGLASYKRPSLVIIVEEFPRNRVLKTDYLKCTKIAEEYVSRLREEGGWDSK